MPFGGADGHGSSVMFWDFVVCAQQCYRLAACSHAQLEGLSPSVDSYTLYTLKINVCNLSYLNDTSLLNIDNGEGVILFFVRAHKARA